MSFILSPLGSESKIRANKAGESFQNEHVKNRVIHSEVCIKGFTGILRRGQIARGSSTSWSSLSKRWLHCAIDPVNNGRHSRGSVCFRECAGELSLCSSPVKSNKTAGIKRDDADGREVVSVSPEPLQSLSY